MNEQELMPPTRSRRRSVLSLAATLLVALMIVGLVVSGGLNAFAQEATPDTAETGSTVLTSEGNSIADVAETANPAVVTIRASLTMAGLEERPTNTDDPFAEPPFGGRGLLPADQPIQTSSGSGFIIDETGHVVTNYQVVAGATEFEAELYDGTVVPATLIGGDAFADIAVLRLDLATGQTMPGTLSLGDSDALRIGDQVVAIGTPLGEYTNTVSAGIIGGIDRALDTHEGYLLENLIQHDASVYPGSSGGPLLNLDGDVVGINTAKAATTLLGGDGADIGFALSINSVRDIIEQLIADGSVSRPYLGIEGRPLRDGHGVVNVSPDSPAETAGLARGDIITAIDGQTIDAEHPLANLLFDHNPGDEITLTVLRDNTELTLTATLTEREA